MQSPPCSACNQQKGKELLEGHLQGADVPQVGIRENITVQGASESTIIPQERVQRARSLNYLNLGLSNHCRAPGPQVELAASCRCPAARFEGLAARAVVFIISSSLTRAPHPAGDRQRPHSEASGMLWLAEHEPPSSALRRCAALGSSRPRAPADAGMAPTRAWPPWKVSPPKKKLGARSAGSTL